MNFIVFISFHVNYCNLLYWIIWNCHLVGQKLLNVNNFIRFNLIDNFLGILFELSIDWCNGDSAMKKNSSSNSNSNAAAAAKSLQSCPTLCDPIDGSPPGSPVPGILQARTLGWVAISFSNAWQWKVKVKSLSRVRLFATPWTAAYQAPPSMGFSSKSTGVGCRCLLPQVCVHV